ncbi:MAG: FAD-binding oxidoreductase, partial [Deinococcota bacterium]|nr:FAD-binding oxidoreductase [Deinococcota bacterium]
VYAGRLADRLYVGGNHRPAECADPGAPAQLQRAATWFLPGLAAAAPLSVWTGVRAKREGNLPVTSALAPGLWFMGCFAGRGFLSAAHVARALAEGLTGG